jgi:Resolvase, N terminal domain
VNTWRGGDGRSPTNLSIRAGPARRPSALNWGGSCRTLGNAGSTPCSFGSWTDGGENVADSIKTIQELASLGVRFIAVTQNLDTDESNPMSRFLLHIMAAFAELERELIRERTVAGVRAAKASGKRLGRPQRVFHRDEVVRLEDGGRLSWREISDRLGVADYARSNGSEAQVAQHGGVRKSSRPAAPVSEAASAM